MNQGGAADIRPVGFGARAAAVFFYLDLQQQAKL
jgi:hypothetical protein